LDLNVELLKQKQRSLSGAILSRRASSIGAHLPKKGGGILTGGITFNAAQAPETYEEKNSSPAWLKLR
jgi:hypothetical protein